MMSSQVSKEEHRSFRDLVWHLIYAREITNELEKARFVLIYSCDKNYLTLRKLYEVARIQKKIMYVNVNVNVKCKFI